MVFHLTLEQNESYRLMLSEYVQRVFRRSDQKKKVQNV